MNKELVKDILKVTSGLIVGLSVGYVIGKRAGLKQSEETEDEEKEEVSEDDYKEAMDKTEVQEDDGDILETPLKEDEVVRVAEPKKHHGPKILGDSDVDPDDPTLEYDVDFLYYFTEDDVITDSNGEEVDENLTIGPKVRQIGFMRGKDDEEEIWIRNYDHETDYCLTRKECSIMDMFGGGEENDE